MTRWRCSYGNHFRATQCDFHSCSAKGVTYKANIPSEDGALGKEAASAEGFRVPNPRESGAPDPPLGFPVAGSLAL